MPYSLLLLTKYVLTCTYTFLQGRLQGVFWTSGRAPGSSVDLFGRCGRRPGGGDPTEPRLPSQRPHHLQLHGLWPNSELDHSLHNALTQKWCVILFFRIVNVWLGGLASLQRPTHPYLQQEGGRSVARSRPQGAAGSTQCAVAGRLSGRPDYGWWGVWAPERPHHRLPEWPGQATVRGYTGCLIDL